MNLQEVADGKKFLELLLEAVNFTGYRQIRRTLERWLFYFKKNYSKKSFAANNWLLFLLLRDTTGSCDVT